ncbi:MAG TPA: Crp/Fnr family transcriptional regulator, partial [Puia sp.]|nr:Crp/Fnr family transcriptional regulator [Puia sp.]
MSTQLILQNVNKHVTLQQSEMDCFTSLLELKNAKRKELLLREKQICRYIYYVNEGALRAF